MTGKFPSIARAHVQTVKTGQMSKIQKRPYKKAFPQKNQMVLYKRPKYVSLTNPPTKPMRPEKKNIDITFASVSTLGASPGTYWCAPYLINGTGTGAGATGRIGRKFLMKSMQLRYQGVVGQTTRCMIIYDKQTNGALPSLADIFATATGGFAEFSAMMNPAYVQRFVVLVDEQIDPFYATDIPISRAVYRKINLETEYFSVSGGSITDIATGALYLVMAQQTSTSTPTPIGTFTSRIRFTDV